MRTLKQVLYSLATVVRVQINNRNYTQHTNSRSHVGRSEEKERRLVTRREQLLVFEVLVDHLLLEDQVRDLNP